MATEVTDCAQTQVPKLIMGRNIAKHIPNNTITMLCDIPDNTTGSPVACPVDDPVWSASPKSESEH